MLKKIITVTMVSGLMLMASVGVFADAPAQDASSSDAPPQDMLYDPELGYEVDLDNPASDTLGCTYVEGLGYEVTINSENLAREDSYSGWVGKGKQAAASWEKAKTGNKAWADVK